MWSARIAPGGEVLRVVGHGLLRQQTDRDEATGERVDLEEVELVAPELVELVELVELALQRDARVAEDDVYLAPGVGEVLELRVRRARGRDDVGVDIVQARWVACPREGGQRAGAILGDDRNLRVHRRADPAAACDRDEEREVQVRERSRLTAQTEARLHEGGVEEEASGRADDGERPEAVRRARRLGELGPSQGTARLP